MQNPSYTLDGKRTVFKGIVSVSVPLWMQFIYHDRFKLDKQILKIRDNQLMNK